MTKLIVVAGGDGNFGHRIVNALLRDPDVRVRVLARKPASPKDPRVEHRSLDLVSATDAERDDAVRGAFSVVSALQGGPETIVDAQLALLRAAKRAGARRFLPSDYSFNFFTLPEGINVNSDWRRTFARRAEPEASASFEIVHVLQGMFLDPAVLAFTGLLDPEQGLVRYWGDGTVPIDWTTMDDTARFVAAAATDDRAVPSQLFVSGDRVDILTFATTWEATTGKKLTRERAGSLEDLDAEVTRRRAAEPQNMYAWLPLMYARGLFGGDALLGPSDNARYPSIRPETVAQVIARWAGSRPSIVHIGLPLDHPSIPDRFRSDIDRSLHALRDRMRAQGYGYDLAFATPESGLAEFRSQLEASHPDAVVIGGGVMANHGLRYFMEQIIDVTHAASPETKILLIDAPDDVPAAALRWFPRPATQR